MLAPACCIFSRGLSDWGLCVCVCVRSAVCTIQVTYAREEDASKALKNTSPTIDGRKTNCNLAAFGNVRRDRPGARNNFEGRGNYAGGARHNNGMPYFYDQQQMMMYGNMQQMDNGYGNMGFPGMGSPNSMQQFNQLPYMAFPAMMMQPAAAGMMMTPQGFMMGACCPLPSTHFSLTHLISLGVP